MNTVRSVSVSLDGGGFTPSPSRDHDFLRCLARFPTLSASLSKTDKRCMLQGFQLASALCQAEPMDYLKYQFYTRPLEQWQDYLTRRQYAQLCKTYNRPKDSLVILRKGLFAARYASFLARQVVSPTPEDRPAFDALCASHAQIILKPQIGGYGRGVRICGTAQWEALWREARETDCVIEEVLRQDETLAQFHPQSVNTVRLLTVLTQDGTPVPLAAIFRCGQGDCITDNHNGVFAPVELASGRISHQAVNHFCEHFPVHPDTGIPFVGAQLPHWDRLLARAVQAAKVLSGLRVMNWDWALRHDGVWALIEGNIGGGLGPCQEALGRGLRNEINSVLQSSRGGASDASH